MNNHDLDGSAFRCLPLVEVQEVELQLEYEYAFLFPSGHVYHVVGDSQSQDARTLADGLRGLGYLVFPITRERHERVLLTYNLHKVTTFVTVLVMSPTSCHS